MNSNEFQNLAAQDATSFDSTFVTNAEAFLVKRWRAFGGITLMDLGVNAFIVMTAAGINAAEAEVPIEEEVNDPDDLTNWDAYLRQQRVIWNTLHPLMESRSAIVDVQYSYDTGWMTVGAKGKGIPYPEGHGPQAIIYNQGVQWSADNVHSGMVLYEGVYLGD